jgi:tetratricopeptide (TPR) repeat protein
MTKTTLSIISVITLLLIGTSSAYWVSSSVPNKVNRYIHTADLLLYTHRGVVSVSTDEDKEVPISAEIALVDQELSEGNTLLALAKYDELLKKDPSNMELLLRMGIIYLQKNEYSLAQEKLSEVYGFKASIFSLDAAWFLALLNAQYEEWEKVEALLKEVVEGRGNYHLQAKELLDSL